MSKLHDGFDLTGEFYTQGHRFDKDTPIEETMQALHDVVKAGWVRYIGMSSCHAYQCGYINITALAFIHLSHHC